MKPAKILFGWALLPAAWIVFFAGLAVVVYSGFRFVRYDYPLMQNRYEDAVNNDMWINNPEPLYNQGLACYIEHDYEGCRKAMLKVYAAACDKNGRVRESQRRLAANAQLYIGNSYFNLGKFDDAVSAYEEGLRLSPGDMYIKYNLEKLQDVDKSKNGGAPAGTPKKKI